MGIHSARSPERTVRAGRKRFRRLEDIGDWYNYASLIKIEEIDLEAEPTKPLSLSRQHLAGPRRPLPYGTARHERFFLA
jgi:hypothetical protein